MGGRPSRFYRIKSVHGLAWCSRRAAREEDAPVPHGLTRSVMSSRGGEGVEGLHLRGLTDLCFKLPVFLSLLNKSIRIPYRTVCVPN